MNEQAVVTTPNADWMPEFPVASPGRICTRVDGSWGPQEYSRWPQMYHKNVIHHACIPVRGGKVPGVYVGLLGPLWDPIDETKWERDLLCGVPDLGFLRPSYVTLFKMAAQSVISDFKASATRQPAQQTQHGHHLCVTIHEALDQLTILPTWRTHAVALAAHVQRLALELRGLVTLFDVIQPRVNAPSFVAKETLGVRGAFTSNAGTAQVFHRLGLPVWFIQPLTKQLRVLELVYRPVPVSSILSDKLSLPRLYSGDGDLAGIVQHPGDWPYKMQEEVLKNLLDVRLAPLPRVQESSGAPPAKKAKAGESTDSNLGGAHTGTAQTAGLSQGPDPGKSSRRAHRGKRAAASPQQGPPHPSLCYRPPLACSIPGVWVDVLTAIGTLPAPPNASTYHWPPPFWFESEGEKALRFHHNYVRIRGFCRQRLLDATIGAEPLRIAEWRDALWGNYDVQLSEATKPDLGKKNKDRRDMQQNIRRLFSNTAGLPTYNNTQTAQWGTVTLDITSANAPATRAQILWEVHEVNWRCELRELDAVLTHSREWGTLQRWEREARVCRVWSPQGSGLRVIPRWEQGERSTATWVCPPQGAWHQSVNTLVEFIGVMARWSGLPEELKRVVQGDFTPSEDDFAKLQRSAVDFYVHRFVEIFNRLPTPPAVLPSNWL
ncbi:uncharacterized protein C8Q71DRAFT_718560 [Rhodofomes roseus]|uniref:Uncharacterized protein n=1 Tax=Rhodofomes roseus TaxID=34475 RepID=A0ABQ8JYJ5_9APHY|nr:uncharacterized protein C8Q71DRAFT_718560 [Rhodofomes roseus]KAH9829233.1 hypothetical protein C8Q71DRAFT_718560 [Rhodofomes roseus]